MQLRHIRVPGISTYQHAGRLQAQLVRQQLSFKAAGDGAGAAAGAGQAPPGPAIITTQFAAIYTCGRREIGRLSSAQQAYLRDDGRADFAEAQRGGQLTFHGPGQLVAYPVLDLRRHGLTPRAYVALLERALVAVCAALGVAAFAAPPHAGVWVTAERKVAALGVHLRRSVTSHGVGLNVSTDLACFDRIVACGLAGKTTTSLAAEGARGATVEQAERLFVEEFSRLLALDPVVTCLPTEDDG